MDKDKQLQLREKILSLIYLETDEDAADAILSLIERELQSESKWVAVLELVEAQNEYISVLLQEIEGLVGMAAIHGWKSQLVEAGEAARHKIEAIKQRLALPSNPINI